MSKSTKVLVLDTSTLRRDDLCREWSDRLGCSVLYFAAGDFFEFPDSQPVPRNALAQTPPTICLFHASDAGQYLERDELKRVIDSVGEIILYGGTPSKAVQAGLPSCWHRISRVIHLASSATLAEWKQLRDWLLLPAEKRAEQPKPSLLKAESAFIPVGAAVQEERYVLADAAARWLLALEDSLVHSRTGKTYVEPTSETMAAVLLPSSFGALRSMLWHGLKNLLHRAKQKAELRPILPEVIKRMWQWERCHRGGKDYSAYLANIESAAQAGELELAAGVAEEGWLVSNDKGAPFHRESAAEDSTSRMAHRFGILLVEDSSTYLETAVRTLRRLCENCKEFSIHLTVADPGDAFSDALHKLHVDALINAVIADWDLASGQTGPGEARTGAQLVELLAREWPSVYTCLLTGRGAIGVARQNPRLTARTFAKSSPDVLEEVFADICHQVRKRQRTPLFSALKAYAQRPVSVYHALATSGGRALKKSSWVHQFHEFYGDRVFLAETSTTLPPLDSLLDPRGSIQEAQEMAAGVFGADATYFVTNGTSSANKIVHQAVLKPGDVVLLDRTCHKSHHYSLVLLGAQPVYLAAEPVIFGSEFTGIFRGIALEEILTQLRQYPSARMLCLTNCTFDGYVHDAGRIVAAVREALRGLREQSSEATDPDEFIFLFDEAWFGFARFLPELRPYTAMFACDQPDLAAARVYVTQSTHKTLIAFRQSSMIHVRDPLFDRCKHAFKEAIYTHSTTSPSYNLLASLDVGRMQADLEGHQFCQEAWSYASSIREWAQEISKPGNTSDPLINEYFYVLTPTDMGAISPTIGRNGRLPNLIPTGGFAPVCEFALDQSKITIFLHPGSGLTGNELRSHLLDHMDIQFNKTTHNTVLLMVNAGATESTIGHLMPALRKIAQLLKRGRLKVKKRLGMNAIFNLRPEFYGGKAALRDFFFRQPGPDFVGKECSEVEFDKALEQLSSGAHLISATFIIPYPPGFPILVPGQIITAEDVSYLKALGGAEIHGITNPGHLLTWQR